MSSLIKEKSLKRNHEFRNIQMDTKWEYNMCITYFSTFFYCSISSILSIKCKPEIHSMCFVCRSFQTLLKKNLYLFCEFCRTEKKNGKVCFGKVAHLQIIFKMENTFG